MSIYKRVEALERKMDILTNRFEQRIAKAIDLIIAEGIEVDTSNAQLEQLLRETKSNNS